MPGVAGVRPPKIISNYMKKIIDQRHRTAIYIPKDRIPLLNEIDEFAKKNYSTRSKFTLLAWEHYLNFIKERDKNA